MKNIQKPVCPKCKSAKIIYTMGSTCYKPINNHLWGLCINCLYEWDTHKLSLRVEEDNICDYCFECGTPLLNGMKEGEDWFDIRNCGESFPICKECHDKAERGELDEN